MINRISVIRFKEINRITVCHSAIFPSPRKWNHIWRFFLKKFARKSLNISTVLFITSPWLALWVNPAPVKAACVMPFFSPVSARITASLNGCTRRAHRLTLQIGERRMTLVDLPGIGETLQHDQEYWAFYRQLPPELIWLSDPAGWWTYAADIKHASSFYLKWRCRSSRFLFVLSHADRVFPLLKNGMLQKNAHPVTVNSHWQHC